MQAAAFRFFDGIVSVVTAAVAVFAHAVSAVAADVAAAGTTAAAAVSFMAQGFRVCAPIFSQRYKTPCCTARCLWWESL